MLAGGDAEVHLRVRTAMRAAVPGDEERHGSMSCATHAWPAPICGSTPLPVSISTNTQRSRANPPARRRCCLCGGGSAGPPCCTDWPRRPPAQHLRAMLQQLTNQGRRRPLTQRRRSGPPRPTAPVSPGDDSNRPCRKSYATAAVRPRHRLGLQGTPPGYCIPLSRAAS